MLNREVLAGPGGRVVLLDSISALGPGDAGAIVVTGSHGGASAAEFALAHPPRLAIFNDAGVGKDDAGVVALERLQAHGIAAASVSHRSARIGDAKDMWDCGRLSRVNAAARALGLAEGQGVQAIVRTLVEIYY